MTNKPFPQCFWVHEGLLCAGHYPGGMNAVARDAKLHGLLDCGIRRVVSLMEPTETSLGGRPFELYAPRLQELADERGAEIVCLNLPIRDATAPTPQVMREILETIDAGLQSHTPTYVHCWGGHGRTGTVVACHLIQNGYSAQEAIDALMDWRAELPKSHYPFEGDQKPFIRSWPIGRVSAEVES